MIAVSIGLWINNQEEILRVCHHVKHESMLGCPGVSFLGKGRVWYYYQGPM